MMSIKRIVCWFKGHQPVMRVAKGPNDKVVGIFDSGPWGGMLAADSGLCFRCGDGRKVP